MTNSRLRYISAAIATYALLAFAAPVPAFALDLDEARKTGLIGERPDGLVAAVTSNANAEVSALVEAINRARLDTYRALAQKEGTALEAVQAVAGERQTQAAARNGWYVMDASGRWRKP